MGFSRQKYWSGLPFSPPGDLPDPETGPVSPALSGGFFNTEHPGKPPYNKEHRNCAAKDQDSQCKRETNIKLLSSHEVEDLMIFNLNCRYRYELIIFFSFLKSMYFSILCIEKA